MLFNIDTAESLAITDQEISSLLSQVYVEGGFTSDEVASTLFEPTSVRGRGKILGAREKQTNQLAGMVIIVYPNSPVRRLAQENEVEMHLLGVLPAFRGVKLGKALVEAAIDDAKKRRLFKNAFSDTKDHACCASFV